MRGKITAGSNNNNNRGIIEKNTEILLLVRCKYSLLDKVTAKWNAESVLGGRAILTWFKLIRVFNNHYPVPLETALATQCELLNTAISIHRSFLKYSFTSSVQYFDLKETYFLWIFIVCSFTRSFIDLISAPTEHRWKETTERRSTPVLSVLEYCTLY